MIGITILDTLSKETGRLFDLRDILAALGADAELSRWRIAGVDCLGREAAEALHEASDRGSCLDGSRLGVLARDVDQIIDGEFAGYLPGVGAPWIVIRAVDSSAYDVVTDRQDVLLRLTSRFSRVRDIPQSEARAIMDLPFRGRRPDRGP